MTLRVKILRDVYDMVTSSATGYDTFLLYGFYSKNENYLYVVDVDMESFNSDTVASLPQRKDHLELVGWGYAQEAGTSFVPFERFKTQARFEDAFPVSVMAVVHPEHDYDLRCMVLNGLRLERVPFQVMDELDRSYDAFISQQRNLAEYTPEHREEGPPPVMTKRGMMQSLIDDLEEKVSYLEEQGVSRHMYPDFDKALELADEGLYGRAGFYLKRVQKTIERDVVTYRYKEKYDTLYTDVLTMVESLANTARKRTSLYEALKTEEDVVPQAPVHQTVTYDEGEEQPVDEDLFPILNEDEFEEEMRSHSPYRSEEQIQKELESMGDLAEKIDALEKILKETPDNTWAWGELGDCYFEAGELEEALTAYERQLRKTPDNAVLLNNMGVIHKLQSRYKKATELFKKAVEADPDYAEAHYNLGFIMFEEGDLDEAIKQYKVALELMPEFNLARDSLKVAMNKRDAYAKQQFTWKNL
jgi:tetratricopeptide (TPR) repeat protein